jgi:hypothetical protein
VHGPAKERGQAGDGGEAVGHLLLGTAGNDHEVALAMVVEEGLQHLHSLSVAR